jgi:hypothetical protein
MDSNEERDQQRDRQFAAAVRSIAETDLELWRDEHDIHALARASHAAAQHAEMLAASGPDIDESAKAHLLAVLQAQSWSARLARLVAHESVVRADAMVAMVEAEMEVETGAPA